VGDIAIKLAITSNPEEEERTMKQLGICCLLGMGILASTSANAWAQTQDEVLFYCTTEQGKVIKLYDLGETIQYSFGPANQPEIVLNVSRNQATTYQWAGVGRSIYYSVEVPNGDTIYNIFWSVDRLESDHPIYAGVDVHINREYVATVPCGSNITSNLEGVNLRPTEF
jgi:hypothetical protein